MKPNSISPRCGRASSPARASRLLAFFGVAAALLQVTGARAQVLDGEFIDYIAIGANGTMLGTNPADPTDQISMRYRESTSEPFSCDVYRPALTVEGFSVRATAPAGTFTALNQFGSSNFATVSPVATVGREIRWSGQFSGPASLPATIRVDQRMQLEVPNRYAVMRVAVTNLGSAPLNEVYYFRSGDPDHGSCDIGNSTFTTNSILRQTSPDPSIDLSTLITSAGGGQNGLPRAVLGIGAFDRRSRVHAGILPNDNNNPQAVWNNPRNPNGAFEDNTHLGIVHRLGTIQPGATENLHIIYVWGPDELTVERRFEELRCLFVDPGEPCNDFLGCTINDVCTPERICQGSPKSCADGLSCTVDSCTEPYGTCLNAPVPGTCAIDNACWNAGDVNPLNSCLLCDPTRSQTQWSVDTNNPSCRSLVDGGTNDGGNGDGGNGDGGNGDGGNGDGGFGDGGNGDGSVASDASLEELGLEVRGSSYLCASSPLSKGSRSMTLLFVFLLVSIFVSRARRRWPPFF